MGSKAVTAHAVFTMAPWEDEYHLEAIFESLEDAVSYSDYRHEHYGEATEICSTVYFPNGTGEFE